MKGFLWTAKSSEQGPHCGLCLSWSDSSTDKKLCVSFSPVREQLLMSKGHSLRPLLQPLPLAQALLWVKPREQFTNHDKPKKKKKRKSPFVVQGEAIPCGSTGGRQMCITHNKPETWPSRTKFTFSDVTVVLSVNIYVIKTEGFILHCATCPQCCSDPLAPEFNTIWYFFSITQAME